jgi:hypothetical protein
MPCQGFSLWMLPYLEAFGADKPDRSFNISVFFNPERIVAFFWLTDIGGDTSVVESAEAIFALSFIGIFMIHTVTNRNPLHAITPFHSFSGRA